jgi:hypothetical protein
MSTNKDRREHNTKRVGEAFRGNTWGPESSHVKIVDRDAQTVESKKAESK